MKPNTRFMKPNTRYLSELYAHATYYKRRKDWQPNRTQSYPRGEFRRDYAQWRVWAKSGLPVDEQHLKEPAVRVMRSRGFFNESEKPQL
jgi:hypothetical protein